MRVVVVVVAVIDMLARQPRRWSHVPWGLTLAPGSHNLPTRAVQIMAMNVPLEEV